MLFLVWTGCGRLGLDARRSTSPRAVADAT